MLNCKERKQKEVRCDRRIRRDQRSRVDRFRNEEVGQESGRLEEGAEKNAAGKDAIDEEGDALHERAPETFRGERSHRL